jgi:hypothetical protein
MITAPQAAPTAPLSKLNKAGLVLAFLLGLADMTGPFVPPDRYALGGPPYPVLLLGAVLGLITIVAGVVAWRTAKRGAVRLAAGARIISMILALPAFFVGTPAWLKVLVGVIVILTVAIVVMVLTPARRPVPVTD